MKLTPKNIEWTIADNKIIKKLNDGTFAEVTQADITALWFSTWSWSLPIIAWTTNNIVSTWHVSTWVNQLVLSKVSNINWTIRLADTTWLWANMTYKKNWITLVSWTSWVSVDTSVVVWDVIELFISSWPTVSWTATISFSFDYSWFMT